MQTVNDQDHEADRVPEIWLIALDLYDGATCSWAEAYLMAAKLA